MALSPLDLQVALIQIGRASHQYLQTSKTPRKKQLNQAIKTQDKSRSISEHIQESPENIDVSLNIELEPQHKDSSTNSLSSTNPHLHKNPQSSPYTQEDQDQYKGTYIDILE